MKKGGKNDRDRAWNYKSKQIAQFKFWGKTIIEGFQWWARKDGEKHNYKKLFGHFVEVSLRVNFDRNTYFNLNDCKD